MDSIQYGVILGALGWLVVSVGSTFVKTDMDMSAANVTGLITGFLGVIVGADAGRIKAFALKLQAQQILLPETN
jgi:hypothetical protein